MSRKSTIGKKKKERKTTDRIKMNKRTKRTKENTAYKLKIVNEMGVHWGRGKMT